MKNHTFSPPVVVSKVETAQRTVHIVREDLLPGGTKRRAVIPYLDDLIGEGYDEFVYASPFCGFAQVALAYGANALEQKAKIFAEQAPSFDGAADFHELSVHARSLGADVVLAESLPDAGKRATTYAQSIPGAFQIPLGFNDTKFLSHYADALQEQFKILVQELGRTPESIWLPVGSGTLTRVFRDVIPSWVHLNCVNVHVLKADDQRIQSVLQLRGVTMFEADVPFHERSSDSTPVPSNAFYDAKIWRFVKDRAESGDVWWNVAR